MNLQQLEYFLAVAKFLNFTRVAEKYFISQTAVTQQIKSLEEQLGVKLFNRSKRKVKLTPAGAVFIEEAQAIINRTKEAITKTQAAATGFFGNLNIGFIKGYEHSLFPQKIQSFRVQHPNISMFLKRNDPTPLFENLEKNNHDIIFNFDFSSENYPNLEKKMIEKVPLITVLYQGHPLAYKSSLSREELRQEAFIVNKINYLKNDGTEKILDRYVELGFIPNIVYESSDIETMLIMISAGMGISILPEYATSMLKNNLNLVYIPLRDENEYIEIYAFWKKDNSNPALQKFLNLYT